MNPSFLFSVGLFNGDKWSYRELANANSYFVDCNCSDHFEHDYQVDMKTYKFRFVGSINKSRLLGKLAHVVNLYIQAGLCERCKTIHWACGDLADLIRISELDKLFVMQKKDYEFEVRHG